MLTRQATPPTQDSRQVPLLPARQGMQVLTLMLAVLLFFDNASSVHAQSFRELDWLDLLPEAEMNALMNASPLDHVGGDASLAPGSLGSEDALQGISDSALQSAMLSTNVREELDQEAVRLPGFVVPLEYNDAQQVTEFFLVPYFGACIHVPPPPPNQIIHVSFPQGLDLPSIFEPYFVEGTLHTSLTVNATATSAYSIDAAQVIRYQ